MSAEVCAPVSCVTLTSKMSEEANENPPERILDPKDRAMEKAAEFRMHAELAAVFEGVRKFDARLRQDFDPDLARDVQRMVGKLEKAKVPNTPVIDPSAAESAAALLKMPETNDLATMDYHIHHRPGETMIVRWLAGDEVEVFYDRLQAHFDATLAGFREEQRSALAWKQDAKTNAFLDAMDALDVKLAERYLREPIRQHKLFVMSIQTADELNIAYLADFIMQVPAEDLVGKASAPPDEPTEQDLAWFFKMFLIRGEVEGIERMCFFTYLQKSEDSAW